MQHTRRPTRHKVTLDPVLHPTISVEEAADALGLGRSAGYAGVRNGDIPVIRVGRRLRVPTAAICQLLHLDYVAS